MRKRIVTKLKSQTGASISFALLLFLICATLCSVIIVAATASSGRMAGIVDMDQRYYGVTSASGLLKNMFHGNTVSFADVTTTTSTTTYSNGEITDTTDAEPVSKVYLLSDTTASQILEALGTDADLLVSSNQIEGPDAEGVFLPISSVINDASYRYYISRHDGTAFDPKTFTLTSNSSTVTLPSVTINEKVDTDGNLVFTVRNTDGDQFVQELVFGADLTQSGGPKQENKTETGTSQNSKQIQTQTSETEITTLTWNLISVKTLSDAV